MKGGKIGLWEAVSMAVGTMIGASIFSILGVGAEICSSNLPIAFLLSAIFSLSVAYSYAHLGSRFVSNAGPIEFIVRGIGDGVIAGALSLLMWFSYVVSISLFAKAFAGYFLALVGLKISPLAMGVVEVLVVAFFTVLNFFGSRAVGRAEFWIVLVKLSILLFFVVVGIWSINPDYLKPLTDSGHVRDTFYAASVLFLSYMGFGLITNASENMENPEKNVPRAIYISIGIVSLVYISVAVVSLGNLGVEGLVRAKEYALAEAARPFLGELGFVLVSIGALFSTSSAINATLYGGANVAYVLAKKGYLPDTFERKVWFQEPEGLYITSILSLFFALFFDLGGISSIISFTFLILYVFVIASHYRLRTQAGGKSFLILLNFVVILAVFFTLIAYQWNQSRESFYASIIVTFLALLIEFIYRKTSGRRIKGRVASGETDSG